MIAKQKQKQGAGFLGDGYACGKALGTQEFPLGEKQLHRCCSGCSGCSQPSFPGTSCLQVSRCVASSGTWVAAAEGELLCSEAAEAIFFTKPSATELMQMQQQQHRQLTGTQHSFNYNPALLRVGLSKATVTLPVRAVTARLGSHQGICILHFSASVLLSPRGPLWLPGCVPKREVHAWRVATPGPTC